MPTLKLTWHTLHGQGGTDGKVCPICLQLDNYTWEINVIGETSVDPLIHPSLGIVASSLGSEVHNRFHIKGECRCKLSYIINMQDIQSRTQEILKELQGVKRS